MGLTNQEIAERLIRNFLGSRVNRTRLIQFIANRRYRHRHAEETVDE